MNKQDWKNWMTKIRKVLTKWWVSDWVTEWVTDWVSEKVTSREAIASKNYKDPKLFNSKSLELKNVSAKIF